MCELWDCCTNDRSSDLRSLSTEASMTIEHGYSTSRCQKIKDQLDRDITRTIPSTFVILLLGSKPSISIELITPFNHRNVKKLKKTQFSWSYEMRTIRSIVGNHDQVCEGRFEVGEPGLFDLFKVCEWLEKGFRDRSR
jgi:hypothetical protein